MHFWKFSSRRERSSPGRTQTIYQLFGFSRKSTASVPSSSTAPAAKSAPISQVCSAGLKSIRRTSSRLLLTLGVGDGPRLPPPDIVNVQHETVAAQTDASGLSINDLDGHSGSGTNRNITSSCQSLTGSNGNHKTVLRLRKRNVRKAPPLPFDICSSSTVDQKTSSDLERGGKDRDLETPPSSFGTSSYHFSDQTTQTVVRRPMLAPRPAVLPNQIDTIVNDDSKDPSPNDAWISFLSQLSNPPPANGLPSIPEVGALCIPVCRPRSVPLGSKEVSIYTVEISAAAKIYLEARFSTILSKDTKIPRKVEDYLRDAMLSPEGCREERARWMATESEHLRLFRGLRSRARGNRHRFISDYEKVRILGKGSFGTVQLIRHKDPADDASSIRTNQSLDLRALRNQVFAMKIIRKSDMLRKSQEGHLRAERDFLVASERSHWVVPLIESFQDTEHLYLVMEYMVGGDFLGLLLRLEILPESMTQFYMAEMVLCVEEIHRMKWIHRDVKPDNFLLSSSGHLKVSDFGLAFDGHWAHNQKYHNETRYSIADRLGIRIRGDDRDSEEARAERLGLQANPPVKAPRVEELQRPEGNLLLDSLNSQWKRRLARTIVGTSQYMAPEVIQGLRYDGRCDWWSIGIILYECLYGRTPFLSETREETKLKIAHYVPPLAFPAIQRRQSLPGNRYILLPPVSGDANALINALISPRESRLSARKYRDNDAQHSRSSRRAAAGNGNGTGIGSGAHADFVFENDAKDIKRHAFFRGVDWDTMHAQVPPFIPRIREDQSITKYFEDEKDILGSGSESATSVDYSECVPIASYDDADVPARVAAALPRIFAAGADPRGSTSVVEALVARAGEHGEGHGNNNEEARFALEWLAKQDARAMKALWKRRRGAAQQPPPQQQQQQQQADGKGKKAAGAPPATRQRPRDKILRDPKMYRTAMHVRKRYAFMGYTYRRPHYVRRGVGVIGGKAGSVVLGVSGQT